jgi:hypothetical protein
MPAPNYYYSTPIGQNINTLANAVQSIPMRRAQQGLYEARQRLMDEQALTEEQERSNYAAQARGHHAKAALDELTYKGRHGLGNVFFESGTTGTQGVPPNAPVEAVSRTDGRLPAAVVGPRQTLAPGTRTPTGVSHAVVDPVAASQEAAAQATGVASAMLPRNRTGLTPAMVAQIAGFGSWAGSKPEDMMQAFAGGNLGALETDDNRALSYVQAGGGMDFGKTLTGTQDALRQRQREAETEAAARRYATDVGARTDISVANIKAAADAAKPDKAKKPPLTIPQQQKLHKNVMDEAENEGLTLKPAEANLVVKKIMERMKEGEDYLQVLDEELTNMVQEVPEEKVSFGTRGNFLGRDKPAHKAFKSPYAESADDAVATSAGQPTGESGAKVPIGHAPWAAKEVYGAIPAALPITSLAGALLGDKAGLGPKVASLVQSMTASGPEYAKGEVAPLPAAAEGAAFAPEPTSAPIKALPPVAPAPVAQKASKKKGSAKPLDTLPAGAKYVGTSGGKPVFELPDGTRRVKE